MKTEKEGIKCSSFEVFITCCAKDQKTQKENQRLSKYFSASQKIFLFLSYLIFL